MTTIVHQIIVELATKGQLGGGSSGFRALETSSKTAEASISRMGEALKSSAGAMSDMFTDAVEKVGRLTFAFGAAAGAAGVAGVVYGVAKLNAGLEDSRIGIGATLAAFGESKDLTTGMAEASGLLEKMRQDAQALPGEFGDLKQFFSMGLSPALQAGLSPDALEKMSANAMATASALQVPMDQAAREFSMLLSGRAGAHNVFGAKLGFTGDAAEKLNKESGAARAKDIGTSLGRFSPAIDEMQHSFSALWSSAIDGAKHFDQLATHTLFGHVKATLESVNHWFDSNGMRTERWANELGDKLAGAWDRGISTAQQWIPTLITFSQDVAHEVERIWDRVGPSFTAGADALKNALGNGDALHGIERVLEMYATLKIGSPLLGGGLKLASAIGPTALGGMGGMGDAVGAAGMGGPFAAGAAALVALGAYGELADVLNPSNIHHGQAVQALDELAHSASVAGLHLGQDLMEPLKDFSKDIGPLLTELAALGLKVEDVATTPLRAAFHGTIDVMDLLAGSVGGLVDMFRNKTHDLSIVVPFAGPKIDMPLNPWTTADMLKLAGFGILNNGLGSDQKANAKAPNLPTGYSGALKVEIVINTNADPSRIAGEVVEKIRKIATSVTTMSPNVPNFSSDAGF